MSKAQAQSKWGGRYEAIRTAGFTHAETVALLTAEDAQGGRA